MTEREQMTVVMLAAVLATAALLGFAVDTIADTPQDCREMCAPQQVKSFEHMRHCTCEVKP